MNAQKLALVQLLSLPAMGPARLAAVLETGSAREILGDLRAGKLSPEATRQRGVSAAVLDGWILESRRQNDAETVDRYGNADVAVLAPGDPWWPFAEDPEPPPLIFCRGNTELLVGGVAVGIVGTRRCTSLGRRVAHELGITLATRGVKVVSGLALGIDGAAHHGALDSRSSEAAEATVVGVVGTGLDVVYPKSHGGLWSEIGCAGLLISEAPLGVGPARWRFPARNRLIAALSDAVVVVESHEKGGALSTADEAADRGVPVLVVPGSVLSPASEGSNLLLMEGAAPVRHGRDVLEILGFSEASALVGNSARSLSPVETPEAGPLGRQVLAELAAGAQPIDVLAGACGASIGSILTAVQMLALDDRIVIDGSQVRLS